MTTSWKQRYFRFLRKLVAQLILVLLMTVIDALGKNSDRVKIKFSRRKDCKQVLQAKKDLKDLNTDDLDLPRGTKIFVNQSLCPYYRMLWSKSKRLRSMGMINSFFISGETAKVKIAENSSPLAITHLNDFTVHFPNVDLSPLSESS